MTDAADQADREPTPAEIESWEREQVFAPDDRTTPEEFPRLWNISAGFTKRAILRPVTPARSEYVTITLPPAQIRMDESIRRSVAVAEWNRLWEAAQFRRRFFDEEELPPDLAKIADRGDINIIFVPRTRSRYYEYAPLYHLLNRGTCERFGLPLLSRGQWPFTIENVDISKYLPDDFEQRLSRAWAATVWRHLNSGSGLAAFSRDDPIRLLAHNLDYWIPPITEAIQDTLREFPVVPGDDDLPTEIRLIDGSVLEGAVPGWPRKGGDLWRGEAEAADFVALTVDQADATGRLRVLVFIRDLGSSVMFFGAFLALIYVATARISFVLIGLADVRARRLVLRPHRRRTSSSASTSGSIPFTTRAAPATSSRSRSSPRPTAASSARGSATRWSSCPALPLA